MIVKKRHCYNLFVLRNHITYMIVVEGTTLAQHAAGVSVCVSSNKELLFS